MMALVLRMICLFIVLTFVSGCSLLFSGAGHALQSAVESSRQAECKLEECIVPDMYEFTFGAAYKDKYLIGAVSGQAKCVKITGKVLELTQGNLNLPQADDSYILLLLSADKATRPLDVYAKLSLRDKFRNIKKGEVVTIYGRAVFIYKEQIFSVLMTDIVREGFIAEKQGEFYAVGKHTVKLIYGNKNSKPCVALGVYDTNSKYLGGMIYDKENPSDMAILETFKIMSEPERKTYLKEFFTKHGRTIDFGPDPVSSESPLDKSPKGSAPKESN